MGQEGCDKQTYNQDWKKGAFGGVKTHWSRRAFRWKGRKTTSPGNARGNWTKRWADPDL